MLNEGFAKKKRAPAAKNPAFEFPDRIVAKTYSATITAPPRTISKASSPRTPPIRATAPSSTSPTHSNAIHGWPCTVKEYGSTVGQWCVAAMICPVLMCHHMSGSVPNVRPVENAAPTRNVPSIAGNENTHFTISSARDRAAIDAWPSAASSEAGASAQAATRGVASPVSIIVAFSSLMLISSRVLTRRLSAERRARSSNPNITRAILAKLSEESLAVRRAR